MALAKGLADIGVRLNLFETAEMYEAQEAQFTQREEVNCWIQPLVKVCNGLPLRLVTRNSRANRR